jgi:uncharacterized delta-60 repeat protein
MKKLFYLLLLFTTVVFSQTAGSVDASFNSIDAGYDIISGTEFAVDCSTIQSDGKIIIGGRFTKYNGVNVNKIARLNTDGTLDTTFNIGTGFSTSSSLLGIVKIKLQADGKIIIIVANGGNSKVFRLNSNGTVDTTFVTGLGTFGNNEQYSVGVNPPNPCVLQSDGKLLLGGNFTSYNTVGKNRIIRLNATNALSIDDNIIKKTFTIYPNPAKDKFTIDFGNELISNFTIKINNMLGQEVYSNVIDKPQFEVIKTWQGEGLYFVKIYNEKNILVGTKKIILQ